MFKSVSIILFSIFFTLTASNALATKVGDAAPNFTAATLDGQRSIDSTELAGKIVFVDFWASWCPPCLKSLPEFEQLQTSFANRDDVVVLAINLDENKKSAIKFANKLNVTYELLADNTGQIPSAFGVKAMPSSYIIDKQGVIRYVHKGYKSGDVSIIKSEIEKLL